MLRCRLKTKKSADRVRRQLTDLSRKINHEVQPIFTSRKLAQELKVPEVKPSIVNQQCVVYEYRCDSCDENYVGYTRRHLHQRTDEHRYSVIESTNKATALDEMISKANLQCLNAAKANLIA